MAKKVLLVEDDPTLLDVFSIILKNEGFDVATAYNGKDALEKVERLKFDVILLDLLMPVMSGIDFLKRFKNKKKTPIIVFSNLDSKKEVEEVFELGASKYMLKAWATPKELVKVIKSFV